jgi:hypothetical protein
LPARQRGNERRKETKQIIYKIYKKDLEGKKKTKQIETNKPETNKSKQTKKKYNTKHAT